jgi:hypothetical protein
MVARQGGIPLVEAAPETLYDRRILQLAFLAPDLQSDILAGRQPPTLNLEQLQKIAVPLAWIEQKTALGWTSGRACYRQQTGPVTAIKAPVMAD